MQYSIYSIFYRFVYNTSIRIFLHSNSHSSISCYFFSLYPIISQAVFYVGSDQFLTDSNMRLKTDLTELVGFSPKYPTIH